MFRNKSIHNKMIEQIKLKLMALGKVEKLV